MDDGHDGDSVMDKLKEENKNSETSTASQVAEIKQLQAHKRKSDKMLKANFEL